MNIFITNGGYSAHFCAGSDFLPPRSIPPPCHPLALTHVSVSFDIDQAQSSIDCTVRVETQGKTGVEMEALTAVQVALLTIYDMSKAIDRGMVMTDIRVQQKHGGTSGSWPQT